LFDPFITTFLSLPSIHSSYQQEGWVLVTWQFKNIKEWKLDCSNKSDNTWYAFRGISDQSEKNHCPRDGSLGRPCRTSSGLMFSRERTGREKREDMVDLIFLILFFLGRGEVVKVSSYVNFITKLPLHCVCLF